jgi:hypothetical protein
VLLKHKPTSVKNSQANAILEHVHEVITTMLCTSEVDMGNTVEPSDIEAFLTDTAWAICSTYYTVLTASPRAAIFGWDMLFGTPFFSDWDRIEYLRQRQTDLSMGRENCSCCDWDYKVGDQVLLREDGILRKSQSQHESDPWTITLVHTNGTIRVQCRIKSEQFNIRRVIPFFNNQT